MSFFCYTRTMKEYGILDEFIDAAKEEEHGLQKIIEAYDKRMMNQSLYCLYQLRFRNIKAI